MTGENTHATGENTEEQLIASGVRKDLAHTIGGFHGLGIEVDMDEAYRQMEQAANDTQEEEN